MPVRSRKGAQQKTKRKICSHKKIKLELNVKEKADIKKES